MSAYDEIFDHERDDFIASVIEDELHRISTERPFQYLAQHGDAIEERVNQSLEEANRLLVAGFHGAAVARAVTGIELAIRFFLVRPLMEGAFLSDEWASILLKKILDERRAASDRELLPAILRNWDIQINSFRLTNGSMLWESIKSVQESRNRYTHVGGVLSLEEARISIECLEVLLRNVVNQISKRLGFTREVTGCWSLVAVENTPEFPDLNEPRTYPRLNPFKQP